MLPGAALQLEVSAPPAGAAKKLAQILHTQIFRVQTCAIHASFEGMDHVNPALAAAAGFLSLEAA